MSSPNANSNDITQVLASLAPRQAGRPKSEIPGPQRAAMLMLALGIGLLAALVLVFAIGTLLI